MKTVKIAIAFVFSAAIVAAVAAPAFGYPPFLVKARKFGAKDCTFCHVQPEGGPPFTERGEWLVAEKERRKAEVVNPEWLVDYKPGAMAKKAEPKAEPIASQKETGKSKVDPKVFDAYVGQYELPMFVLNIMKEGDRLFGQPEGDTKEELIPESETEFSVTNVGAKVKFVKDEKGTVTHIVVSLNGEEFKGKKIK
ncbi:MAG: DUF3471 domain-containing protein [Acidobacteriota bacterium]